MIEMFLIFCCAGIGEILSVDVASTDNPGVPTAESLISNLRTERANKKLRDWSDNLESAASLLDQSDGEGDSTMDHSGYEDEGRLSTTVPSGDSLSGGKSTQNVTASTATDGGDVLAAAGRIKSAQQKCSSDCVTVSGSSKAGGKYLAVRNYREDKLQFPDLTGGNSSQNKTKFYYGSFRNEGDNRIILTDESNDIRSMTNLSSSFNMSSFMCSVCPVKHEVLRKKGGKSGGLGGGGVDDRTVLVLSDQNFPAALPSTDGMCLSVLRVEHASLNELADSFTELTKGGLLPEGSMLLLSSVSHLARVGTESYCLELVSVINRLRKVIGHSSFVSPGPFIMGGGTNDKALIKSLIELYSWLSNLSEVAGICLLKMSYLVCLESLKVHGSQDKVTDCGCSSRLSLPVSLVSPQTVSWTSVVGNGLPSVLACSLASEEERTVFTLLDELRSKLAFNLGKKVNFCRNPDTILRNQLPMDSTDHLLVVGSSHSRRISQYLDMANVSCSSILIPNWRASASKAEALTEEVKKSIAAIPPGKLDKTVVIFQLLDNSVYMARTDEGALIPCRRESSSNRYHVDGDLMLAPRELVKNLVNLCTPILRAAGDLAKIMLVPLPRYTSDSCCEDPAHAANTREPGFKEQLLSDLNSLKKTLKDLCFNANIRNIRCLNLGGLVEDDNDNWGEDPVHPKPDCYGRIATKIIHEAAMLLQAGKSTSRNQPSATERNTKRSSSTEDGNCSKRQRSSAAGQPISNPLQWTSSAPSFARGHGRGQLTWRGSQEARRWTSGRGYRGRWPRKPRGAHYSRW